MKRLKVPIPCPRLAELPSPPSGNAGWPWTEESAQLPDIMPALSGAEGPDGSPWPRVSIVTPSYNQAQFIEETIRSVLLQGYPNLEYIIIDGGSTDNSVDIIRRYEPWLSYWVSEKDRGQSHAINKGFDLAQGEIFAWLNSDDVYAPYAFATAAQAFAERPDCGLVYGDAHRIDIDGQLLGPCKHVQSYDRTQMLERCNLIVQPAAFFRRTAFLAVAGLDESLHNVMDYDLWFRLADHSGAAYIPSTLAKARIYAATKTQASGRRRFDEIEMVARRYGARKLPSGWRGELAIRHLQLAWERVEAGDRKSAMSELFYVLRKAPEAKRRSRFWRLFVRSLLPPALARALSDIRKKL